MSARKRKKVIDIRQCRWARWHLSMPGWYHDEPAIDLRELAEGLYEVMSLIESETR